MAFTRGIKTINATDAGVQVVNSTTLIAIPGFTFNLAAGKRIKWVLDGVFTLGATGGFSFQCDSSTPAASYWADWVAVEDGGANAFINAFTAETLFTAASNVAANYLLKVVGEITANTNSIITWQFAQNHATANPIILVQGTNLEITQF